MAIFSDRHNGYKIGVLLLHASGLMATWGVIAPGWQKQEFPGNISEYHHLWFEECEGGFSHCFVIEFNDISASYYATLVLSCMGLFLLLCSCAVAIHHNWCINVPIYDPAAQVLAGFSGVLLFTSGMTYLGATFTDIQDNNLLQYGPSFIFTLTASLASTLGAILMAVYNRRIGIYRPSNSSLFGAKTYQQIGYEISGRALYGSTRVVGPPPSQTGPTEAVKEV